MNRCRTEDLDIQIFDEAKVEKITDEIFSNYEEMQKNNFNFEDVIVKYAVQHTENVTEMAGFLFNYFQVSIVQR